MVWICVECIYVFRQCRIMQGTWYVRMSAPDICIRIHWVPPKNKTASKYDGFRNSTLEDSCIHFYRDKYRLVGGAITILKIMKSMGRIIPYIMENKKCLKPPTSRICGHNHTSTGLKQRHDLVPVHKGKQRRSICSFTSPSSYHTKDAT